MSRCGFGERLRKLREDRGVLQVELARSLGVSASLICSWESGARIPMFTGLVGLADALGISLDLLMRGHEFGASVS